MRSQRTLAVEPRAKSTTSRNKKSQEPKPETSKGSGAQRSKSAAIAAKGIRTGQDYANLMSAMMSDLLEGTVETGVSTAVVSAGRQLLKVVEMEVRLGKNDKTKGSTLILGG